MRGAARGAVRNAKKVDCVQNNSAPRARSSLSLSKVRCRVIVSPRLLATVCERPRSALYSIVFVAREVKRRLFFGS